MQRKKETVRNELLSSGLKIFLEKGYHHASMRQIVKEAGTTIGNFYNYFESKEALFNTLVKEDYAYIVSFLRDNEHHHDMDLKDLLKNKEDLRNILRMMIPKTFQYIDQGLVLLINKSKGTPFEKLRIHIIEGFSEHLKEHLLEKDYFLMDDVFIETLAENFLIGLSHIIEKESNLTKRYLMIVELIMFYITGVMGIL